jgi:predicted ATP-grasp superfamily ATP-dependent carboligase
MQVIRPIFSALESKFIKLRSALKIFVCEYISGGGLYREPLPSSLAREGILMRDALLRDIAGVDLVWLKEIEIITSHDVRLPPPQYAHQAVPVAPGDDVWEIWRSCIDDCDAVWLIAPESDGVLSRLTEIVTRLGKTLLGSTQMSVDSTSSKLRTQLALQAAGIATVPTCRFADWPQNADWLQNSGNSWVAKPDDGVGCSDNAYFEYADELRAWMEQGRMLTHIIQPYQSGIPASLSMLCKHGQAWLLSSNLQKIMLHKNTPTSGKFSYAGSVVNGMVAHWTAFELVAQQVAAAFPGLCGYIGVDMIVEESAGASQIHVLEINPRLTTSYVGLRDAIGCNPANLILDLFYNEHFRFTQKIARNVVEITLNE